MQQSHYDITDTSHAFLVISYVLAILTLGLCLGDTVVRYCRFRNVKTYRFVYILLAILTAEVGLIAFIEVNKFKNGISWVSATLALAQVSCLLAMMLEAKFVLRICEQLDRDTQVRDIAYRCTYSILSIVALLLLQASASAHMRPYWQASGVLLLVGCCFAHLYLSLFPLCLLYHAGELTTQFRNRKSWGLFGCSALSMLVGIATIGLLAVNGLYAKFLAALTSMFSSLTPWTILYVYKTRPVGPGIVSPEELMESPSEAGVDLSD